MVLIQVAIGLKLELTENLLSKHFVTKLLIAEGGMRAQTKTVSGGAEQSSPFTRPSLLLEAVQGRVKSREQGQQGSHCF